MRRKCYFIAEPSQGAGRQSAGYKLTSPRSAPRQAWVPPAWPIGAGHSGDRRPGALRPAVPPPWGWWQSSALAGAQGLAELLSQSPLQLAFSPLASLPLSWQLLAAGLAAGPLGPVSPPRAPRGSWGEEPVPPHPALQPMHPSRRLDAPHLNHFLRSFRASFLDSCFPTGTQKRYR